MPRGGLWERGIEQLSLPAAWRQMERRQVYFIIDYCLLKDFLMNSSAALALGLLGSIMIL